MDAPPWLYRYPSKNGSDAMSLIRIRRNRKKAWIDTKKGAAPRKLILFFAGVVIVIWYLGLRF